MAKIKLGVALVAATMMLGSAVASPKTAEFSYQGQIRENGVALDGVRELTFRLYDAREDGDRIGQPIKRKVEVREGIFSTKLDFGPVFDGEPRWLEVWVSDPNPGSGPVAYVMPRIEILSVPYAQTAWRSIVDEVKDDDADPTNETITEFELDGAAIRLVEADREIELDLSELADTTFGDGVSLDGAGRLVRDALVVDSSGNVEIAGGDLSVNGRVQASQFFGDGSGLTNLQVSEDRMVLSRSANALSVFPQGEIYNITELGASVPLPFPYRLGGVNYTHVYVSRNGWIEFQTQQEDLGPDNLNECLPTDRHQGPFVAAWWDNLEFRTGSIRIYEIGDAPNRVLVVWWVIFNARFDVTIHEGSDLIQVAYWLPGDYSSSGSSSFLSGRNATIGFQTAGGASAKAYPLSCNAQIWQFSGDARLGSWSIAPVR